MYSGAHWKHFAVSFWELRSKYDKIGTAVDASRWEHRCLSYSLLSPPPFKKASLYDTSLCVTTGKLAESARGEHTHTREPTNPCLRINPYKSGLRPPEDTYENVNHSATCNWAKAKATQTSINSKEGRLWHSHTVETTQKQRTVATCNNMDESYRQDVQRKRPDAKE